jgi:isocitrate dehydrogenase (NAD+)
VKTRKEVRLLGSSRLTRAEYSGFEQAVEPGVVQSLKITTDRSTRRIANFAFEYAKRNGREKVTCIHKANIQ